MLPTKGMPRKQDIKPETMCFPNTECAKQGPMPLSYRCHDARKTTEFGMLTRRPIHPHVLLHPLAYTLNHAPQRRNDLPRVALADGSFPDLPRPPGLGGLSIVPSGTLMMFLSSFYIPKVLGSSTVLRNTTTQQGHSVSNMKKVKRSSAFNYPCQKIHEHAQGPF